MFLILWILLGLGLGFVASRMVNTTGEGTIVDILIGIVGGVGGGGLYNLFTGTGTNSFDMATVYSAASAAVGAIILLGVYHAFFRRRML